MNTKTFYQAVLFGIVTILLGLLISLVMSSVFPSLTPKLPAECEIWDKYYVMEITLFFTGFMLRYVLSNQHFSKYLYDEYTQIY